MLDLVADNADAIRAGVWWLALAACVLGAIECFAWAIYLQWFTGIGSDHRGLAVQRLARLAMREKP